MSAAQLTARAAPTTAAPGADPPSSRPELRHALPTCGGPKPAFASATASPRAVLLRSRRSARQPSTATIAMRSPAVDSSATPGSDASAPAHDRAPRQRTSHAPPTSADQETAHEAPTTAAHGEAPPSSPHELSSPPATCAEQRQAAFPATAPTRAAPLTEPLSAPGPSKPMCARPWPDHGCQSSVAVPSSPLHGLLRKRTTCAGPKRAVAAAIAPSRASRPQELQPAPLPSTPTFATRLRDAGS